MVITASHNRTLAQVFFALHPSHEEWFSSLSFLNLSKHSKSKKAQRQAENR